MMTPLIVLAIGLLLIFIEFYLPGGVMGVIGGVVVATSVFIFASKTSAAWAVLLYIIAVALLLFYLVKFALWRIRTAKPDFSIYSAADQEGFVASDYDKKAVGKRGEVLSDLKPGGYILIEGVQHQALSESGYIPRGSSVEVIGGQGESLIVKSIKPEGS